MSSDLIDPLENYREPERTLIFVHGRDFKPSPDALLDLNTSAIAAGIERDFPGMLDAFYALDKRLAYYGDLGNAWLRAAGKHYDEKLDINDRKQALQEIRGLQKRKSFSLGRYERLPGKNAMRELAADFTAPMLGTIGLAERLIATAGGDVTEYWNAASDFGTRVRERVRSAILAAFEEGRRIMLVSHGTGSIASYDALWQLSNDPEFAGRYGELKIDNWLTLGSPLGDSMVRRRLFGARAKGRERYPANILVWHNVSAEDDYLCHDGSVSDDYSAMLRLRLVGSIRDYHIYNLAVRYGRSNPHSSLGYLAHPRVAKLVADWLRLSGPVSLPSSIL
ncbi:MAG TPA: hypothetical protein VFG91_00815 [Woeseiaceae bacterium]|nr:hypothetical protein [Woeseiaceae bacterium]